MFRRSAQNIARNGLVSFQSQRIIAQRCQFTYRLNHSTKKTIFSSFQKAFSTGAETSENAATPPVVEEPEVSGNLNKHDFRAETRQLLDIVTHSIYTEKEVFVRELISNASDALEKLRHMQSVGENINAPELKPEIHITTNEEKNILTIADTGIGMSKGELLENLGTIAKSGSKAFLDQLKSSTKSDSDSASMAQQAASSGIIGKFGVGFYSAFMVADSVQVFTQSALSQDDGQMWQSDGSGSYEIADATHVQRGSKIVIHLKDDCKEYAQPHRIESIIQQYSNFVAFPIYLNGQMVNTVEALWAMDPKEITEEKYSEFYKFIANAFDEPMYRLQYRADAPLELKSLFFVGSTHSEKFGFARISPGVSLYSRKVLIERNAKDILPDWLRFVRGVVDSEDLPLSIAREKMQDQKLLLKLKDILTKKIIKFFQEQANIDPEKYNLFFKEYGQFLKEGICMDFNHKDAIAKLLRYESSIEDEGKTTSLDEYVSRCSPDQDKIYYLCAPSRKLAETSPYFEAFKRTGKEAIFVFNPIDDFVMNNVGEYNGRKIINAESANIEIKEDEETDSEVNEKKPKMKKLSQEKIDTLTAWLTLKLQDENVKQVKASTRLAESPAVISDHESASVRRMMALVNSESGMNSNMAKHVLEINTGHVVIKQLSKMIETNPELAERVAKQLHMNSKLAAGLVEDGRVLAPGLNELLEDVLTQGLK